MVSSLAAAMMPRLFPSTCGGIGMKLGQAAVRIEKRSRMPERMNGGSLVLGRKLLGDDDDRRWTGAIPEIERVGAARRAAFCASSFNVRSRPFHAKKSRRNTQPCIASPGASA